MYFGDVDKLINYTCFWVRLGSLTPFQVESSLFHYTALFSLFGQFILNFYYGQSRWHK